jgi:hypothetical protein
MFRARRLSAYISLVLGACTPDPLGATPALSPSNVPAPMPAQSAVPASAPVDTGKDCASATARCGGGACDVTVKNACDQAVRCVVDIAVTCATQTGSVSVAGKDRATIGARETGDVGAQVTCPDGTVTHTEVTNLSCK